jgi:hypothetical protein
MVVPEFSGGKEQQQSYGEASREAPMNGDARLTTKVQAILRRMPTLMNPPRQRLQCRGRRDRQLSIGRSGRREWYYGAPRYCQNNSERHKARTTRSDRAFWAPAAWYPSGCAATETDERPNPLAAKVLG